MLNENLEDCIYTPTLIRLPAFNDTINNCCATADENRPQPRSAGQGTAAVLRSTTAVPPENSYKKNKKIT